MSESSFLTVGGQTSFDMPLTFRAQSAVINNLSNQWVELLDANDTFVPPYIVNMIVAVGGGTRFRASFASPTGIPQAATIAGQRVAVEVFETAIPPNAGQLFPVRAPSTERRNPKMLKFNSGANIFSQGTPEAADWSYTVPTGRRFVIESAQVLCEITTAFTATNLVAEATVRVQAGGAGTFTAYVAAIVLGGAGTVRARADAALASSKELAAGDVVQGTSGDIYAAGAGSATYLEIMTGTEFDA